MPNTPGTPIRSIRVPDDLWVAAKAKAARQETNVTAIVVAALAEYVVTTAAPTAEIEGERRA